VILAPIVRHVLNGAVQSALWGYRTTRSELSEVVPPDVVAAALGELRTEGAMVDLGVLEEQQGTLTGPATGTSRPSPPAMLN
jgi:hypothetical protein